MRITLTAGPHNYVNCPITFVPEEATPNVSAIVDEDGNRLACQMHELAGKPAITWIEPQMKPGQTKTYSTDSAAAGADGVAIEDIGGGKLEVRVAGKLFTRYHYGEEWVRPFLYPFVGPRDTPVTRNWPIRTDIPGETEDHPHHKSVWVAYGDVNGTDNWGEGKGHGWIRHLDFEEVSSGPVFGRIRTRNSWTTADGRKQMEDVRQFTFYALDSERLMDVDVRLIAAEEDVLLAGTKEGGIISVRVATSMDGDKGGMIVNAYGGKTEGENWGRPAQWVDYYGQVEGKTMGITIMDHPSSFRYPTRWHVRDYGLFTANPFAMRDYEPARGESGDHMMRNGESLSFSYRLYVHEGDTQAAGVGERYFCFIAPPRVSV